jgi:hypothetical protein
MREKGAPILIGLLALMAVRPVSTSVSSAPAAAASVVQAETGAPPTADTVPETAVPVTEAKPQWQKPLGLYREFFRSDNPETKKEILTLDLQTVGASGDRKEHLTFSGQRESVGTPGSSSIHAIVEGANDAGYKLEFLIALLPDPIASDLAMNSDQALAGIQSAFADSLYLLDRFWLPWTDESASRDRTYQTTPGLLLFRRVEENNRRVAGVFLVGETPKRGVHKAALANTLDLIASFVDAMPGEQPMKPVRIVGPSFSGSAESLRLALRDWQQKRTGRRPMAFQIISGTATAQGLEKYLTLKDTTFCRTVLPDDVLLRESRRYLDKLGWDNRKVAMLTESDTGYRLREDLPFIQVLFPSGLSGFRTESEAREKGQPTDSGRTFVTVPKTALDLSLAEPSRPLDIIPELSSLTPRNKQLAISNLLATISREGIRRVGIQATDVRDRIFLAKMSRELFPDVILFSLSNDLLYVHPKYGADLDGMLVLSTAPLLTEGPRWRYLLGGPNQRYRRQFGSEFEEGIFHAVQSSLDPQLVAPQTAVEPKVWIAAVGNGSLWPLASLEVADWDAVCLPFAGRARGFNPSGNNNFSQAEEWRDLPLLGFVLVLVLLALVLGHVAPPLRRRDWTERRLLTLGWASLWLFGATLVILDTLPLPPSSRSWSVVGLGTLYAILLWAAARWKFPTLPRRWVPIALLMGAFGTPLLYRILQNLWMPDLGMPEEGLAFFYLRARKFSSGLSPLVALALCTSAFYTWILLELQRRRLIARQVIAWPLAEPCEPPLRNCADMAMPLEDLMARTLPTRQSRFWRFFVLAVVVPAFFLLRNVQPIAETRGYGRIFIVLILSGLCLAAVSFYQFIRLWLTLRRLLERLGHTRLMQAFQRIAKEVDWKPMRSFGWQMPTFQTVVLSAAKFERVDWRQRKEEVRGLLDEIFEAERQDSLTEERSARRKLQKIFSQACHDLAKAKATPEIDDFFAVRMVAYLRPVLSHMRNALLASMASGLLTLAAVRTYAFEPQQLLSFGLWGALLVAVAVTLWVFVEMDRNHTLSTIGGTEPGQVTFDRHFLLNISTYGLIPVLGVLVSQFPQVGRLFAEWFNPLLRVTGAN